MWTGQISLRYAKALYRYSSQTGMLDKVYNEMLVLQQVLLQVKSLHVMLSNPILPVSKKLQLLQQVVNGTPTTEYTRFCQLLLRKKRESYLLFIVHSFVQYYKQQQHIVTSRVVSPYPLSENQQHQLRQFINRYKEGSVELEMVIDKSLLGGFILHFDTYRLDASVNAQLRNIKQQLLERK